MTGLNTTDLIARIESHALALGIFSQFNGYEPKSAPRSPGLVGALWSSSIAPIRSSGLAATSARVEFNVRVYQTMLKNPQESIDPTVMDAVDQLFTAYSGDFDLGGTVRHIDLLGAYGTPLQAVAGYIDQDNTKFRVMLITLPVIVNDAWSQGD